MRIRSLTLVAAIVVDFVLASSEVDKIGLLEDGPKLDSVLPSVLPPDFKDEHLHGLSYVLDEAVGKLLNVAPANAKGTRSEFADYALRPDASNDKLAHATTQELIVKAGFRCETHHAMADDGYITELIRIINPLAERRKLKQPPVALFHGGFIDTSIFIVESTVQHHPEQWPRVEGQMQTSSNRSLGFVLANNGYDVWLIGTRGCNRANQGHQRLNRSANSFGGRAKSATRLRVAKEYWSNHTYDDIIEKELPRQLDLVMHLSGTQRVSLVGLSNSAFMTMALLSSRPDYATKVHNYVVMAPLLSDKNSNTVARTFYRTVCTNLNDDLGAIVFSELLLSDSTRKFVLNSSKSEFLRYTLTKGLYEFLFGPSPRFQTLLELNVVGHLLKPFGFRTLKHLCQVLVANKMQHFNYGPIGNKKRYGSERPPAYDLSKMECDNWLLVTFENDPFSSLADHRKLIATTPKKPFEHIYIRNANHLDSIAMADVDTKINLPILRFMDTFPDGSATSA